MSCWEVTVGGRTHSGASKRSRVLIVDDSAPMRAVLHQFCVALSYDVAAEVPTAEAALEVLDAQAVDVVICDYRLPRLSGLDLEALVAERFPDVPLLVLSGDLDLVEECRRGFATGSRARRRALCKPVMLGELGSVLDALCEGS
jgi:CheY-like chemotaxis protein